MIEHITTDPASNYGLDISTQDTKEYRRTPILLMCGRNVGKESYCDRPVVEHPFVPTSERFVVSCDRNTTDPESTDYWLSYGSHVLPYENYSGSEANVQKLIDRTSEEDSHGNILDENDYVYVDRELQTLDSWRDKDVVDNTKYITLKTRTPDGKYVESRVLAGTKTYHSTLTLEQHRHPSTPTGTTGVALALDVQTSKVTMTPANDSEYISKQLRNAYVEGNEGFLAREELDFDLTRKHHAHLLNVFLDKQTGDIRIGGIRIIRTVDHYIEARCVLNTCHARMAINPETATRDEQVQFVTAIIRHGNNHAARFIRTRATWYKLHEPHCTLTDCRDSDPHCGQRSDSQDNSTEHELDEIAKHMFHCHNSECLCIEAFSRYSKENA